MRIFASLLLGLLFINSTSYGCWFCCEDDDDLSEEHYITTKSQSPNSDNASVQHLPKSKPKPRPTRGRGPHEVVIVLGNGGEEGFHPVSFYKNRNTLSSFPLHPDEETLVASEDEKAQVEKKRLLPPSSKGVTVSKMKGRK